MPATFEALIGRARSFVRDATGSFIDDDDLGNWINEAYRDLAARLSILQRQEESNITGLTPADRQTLALPVSSGNATYEILSLRLGDVDVQFVADEVFNSWQDSAGTPPVTIARVFDGQIELYPIPEEGTEYTLRYAFVPAELVQQNDIHILPVQLERKLVEYAVAQAKYKDGDDPAGDRWFMRYEQDLPQVSRGRETLQPGPMSFTPAATYFELDAASHRSNLHG